MLRPLKRCEEAQGRPAESEVFLRKLTAVFNQSLYLKKVQPHIYVAVPFLLIVFHLFTELAFVCFFVHFTVCFAVAVFASVQLFALG